jgi:hypothetical protein
MLMGIWLPRVAHAQTDDARRQVAARQFDAGLEAFREQRYAASARAFFSAYRSAPSSPALDNALAAALRAEEPVLLAQIAQAVLDEPASSEEQVAAARDALAQVQPVLARLEIPCAQPPCEILLDGERVEPGLHYLAPGAHRVRLGAGEDVQVLRCSMGQLCVADGALSSAAAGAGDPVTRAEPDVEERTPRRAPVPSARPEPARRAALPLVVFASAGASTLTFAVLTIRTGVLALHERDQADSQPADYSPGRVHRLARSANAFAAASLLSAIATAAVGIW